MYTSILILYVLKALLQIQFNANMIGKGGGLVNWNFNSDLDLSWVYKILFKKIKILFSCWYRDFEERVFEVFQGFLEFDVKMLSSFIIEDLQANFGLQEPLYRKRKEFSKAIEKDSWEQILNPRSLLLLIVAHAVRDNFNLRHQWVLFSRNNF